MTRRRRAGAIALLVAVAAVLAVPSASADGEQAAMQRLLDTLRVQYSSPGAGITFGDGGEDATLSSGTRDILTLRRIEPDDMVRVGSDTKMFVAAVVLQLVDEGRLDLDVPIEQYVPGALRYPADKVPGDPADFDGRTVTLRQLLQHTGGVPDYADLPYVLNPVHQVLAPKPQDHVAHAVAQGPAFPPGSSWRYSNTGYALIGMVIEATTGRWVREEIDERIVRPLGLTSTFFAERGQRWMPGEHVHGYLTSLAPLDVTYFEPAVWGAAGALVSSPDDMNTFMSALIAGEVVSPAMLAQMQAVVPAGDIEYGLGLVRVMLSCGEAWGHGGFVAGYQTLGLARPDGRHAFFTLNTSVAVHVLPPPPPVSAYELFELAVC